MACFSHAHSTKVHQTGFRHYSSEQGLSQNTINHIYQDKNRFIWLSTGSGLNRLDGRNIEIIDDNSNNLENIEIISVKQDSDSNYWVMSYKGLTKLDKTLTQSEHFNIPSIYDNGDWLNYPIDILEVDKGEYWLVTHEGLFKLSEEGRDIESIPSMQEFEKRKININHATRIEQSLWLSTSKGIYVFDTNNKTLTPLDLPDSLKAESVKSINTLPENRLLIQFNRALYVLDISKGPSSIQQIFGNDERIVGLTKYKNSYFFSIADELHQVDLSSLETVHLMSLTEVLPAYVSYDITRLFVDQNQKLWIGTTSKGALVWDPESTRFKSMLANVENATDHLKTIWTFTEDENDSYWIGSDEGLYYLEQPSQSLKPIITINTPGIDFYSVRIFQIIRMNETLWLATANGLLEYSLDSGEITTHSAHFIESEELFIYSMTATSERDLWLSTANGPLHFNFDKKIFRRVPSLEGEDSSKISAFVRHYNNRLWFGFAKSLVAFDYSNQRSKKVFEAPFHSGNNEIFLTDFRIKDDMLWTAYSGKGIYVSKLFSEDYEIVHHFSSENGFSGSVIYSLIPDGDYFWASSHSGLTKINSKDFTYKTFDYYDGLPSTEFNEGATLVNSNGDIIFGGSSDAIVISPSEFKQPSTIPAPAIASIRIKDRKLIANAQDWNDRKIKLSPEEKFIQFQITSHDYLNPDKWLYQYRLEGPTAIDQKETSSRELIFSDLKSGHYTLYIQAFSNESKDTSTPFAIRFYVDAPFWLMPSVTQTAYISFLLLVFLFFYRQSKVKTKFVSLYHQLKAKESRLELALLDDRRGIWECAIGEAGIDDSNLTIVMTQDEELKLSFSQYTSLIHRNDFARVKASWQEFLSGTKAEFEETYRVYLYERWIWTKVVGKVFTRNDKGEPRIAVGSWLDITRDKSFEESLQIYKNAVQNTQDIILLANHKMEIISVNNAFERATGFSKKQLLGRNALRIGQRNFSLEIIEQIRSQVVQEGSWRGELLFPKKDGSSFPANIAVDRFKNESQINSYVIAISDISGLGKLKPFKNLTTLQNGFDSVPNKSLINDRLIHAIEHAKANDSKVTVINLQMLVKEKNSYIQSDFNSKFIETCSEALGRLLADDDTLARLGKDRFLLLMEDDCEIETIIFRIDRLISRLNAQLLSIPEELKVQFKAGIAIYPLQDLPAEKFLTESSHILRQIQQTNKFYEFAHKPTQQLAIDKVNMKNALLSALKNEQLFLVYQPKKDIHTLRTVGFEVLLRWRSPDGKIVYPSQFIELANQAGLIRPLTDWLVKKAFKVLGRWKKEGLRTAFSLNLQTPSSKYSQVINSLLQELESNDLSVKDLHIEINEKELSLQNEEGLQFIEELAKQKIQVTIDDFGKWELPISKLKTLPVYAIKMHRDFTRSIGKDKNSEALIKTIHLLCNQSNFLITSKGVETREQIEFLRESGSHIVQGYYFSDPLMESQARQYLLENK